MPDQTSYCAGITQPLNSNHSLDRRMTSVFLMSRILQENPGPKLLAVLPHQVAFFWLLLGAGPHVPGVLWVV